MMQRAEIKIGYDEPAFEGGSAQQKQPQAPGFEELWGTIRIVSSAPTWTPRGRFEDSIALYSNAGTRRLYIYDHEAGSWHYATLT